MPEYMQPDDDWGPVTEAEIERTHDRIRAHMRSRAKTFRQNFRRFDADGSGKIDFKEASTMIMALRLNDVREKCLIEIFKLADSDNSGALDYTEFCALMIAEDALRTAKQRKLASVLEGGPWQPQGGRMLSHLALTMRQSNTAQMLNGPMMNGTSLMKGTLTSKATEQVFVKGKPFNRNMWHERRRMQREEEKLSKYQSTLRVFAPRKLANMSFEEGIVAYNFWNEGGEAWNDWSKAHWKMPPLAAGRPHTAMAAFGR